MEKKDETVMKKRKPKNPSKNQLARKLLATEVRLLVSETRNYHLVCSERHQKIEAAALKRDLAELHEKLHKAFEPVMDMRAFVYPSDGPVDYQEIQMPRLHRLRGDLKVVVECRVQERQMHQLQNPDLYLQTLSEHIGRYAQKLALEKLRLVEC